MKPKLHNVDALVSRLQRQPGRAIPYAVLCNAIWPGRDASLHDLTVLVHLARKRLPPDAISTTPGYGYAWTRMLDPHSARVEVRPRRNRGSPG